jgi:hypothetical protein
MSGVREIIGDVECLPDFLRRLALDHVCNSLASRIEKGLDIQIIRSLRVVSAGKRERGFQEGLYKNNFKQHFLVDLHKLLVPVIDVCGLFIALVVFLVFRRVIFMVIGPFKYLHTRQPNHPTAR